MVVTDPDDVNRLARLFARLWQLSTWDLPPHRNADPVDDRPDAASQITPPGPPTSGTGPIWTWGKTHHIATAIADIVNAARTDLILATFSIASMTYPIPKAPALPELLFDPVCRAVERGVRVRMLIRGRNFLPSARAEATAFTEAGAEIIPDRLNHAKAVIADETHGALFSANFMTTGGLTGGVEVGMRLDGTPALVEARRYFEHAMTEANMEFVQNPALGDLADTLYAEALTRWPLPRTLPVVADDADWDRLAAQQGAVLFERTGTTPITLHSGRSRWTLENVDGSWLLLPKERQEKKQRTADTFETWLTGKTPKGVERGLCPVTLVRATD